MESNSCFMEKKRLRGRDILRMDGLLPPTRRLPVCNAVASISEKKKEKKWTIGGILKRISSIRDDDSSSNEEEIVYCKKQPRNPAKINKRPNNIVLHPVKNNCERRIESNNTVPETNVERSIESSNVQRDSLQSRSRDGSLEGLVRKIRKNKIKARVEAKRDQLCANSSSDEDSRISNNSLAKPQPDDHSLNICETNSYNRRTRGARTERYIKRLFKEEVCADDGNQINSKQNSLESFEEAQRVITNSSDASKPVTQSRQSTTQSNDFTTTMHKPVALNSQVIDYNTSTRSMENRTYSNNSGYSTHGHFTDMNQNNFYEKSVAGSWTEQEPKDRFTVTLAKDVDLQKNHTLGQRIIPRSPNPPDPPPRDPRRVPAYTCHSFPFNGRSQKKRQCDGYAYGNLDRRMDWIGTRAYSSSEEIARGDVIKTESHVPLFESTKTNIRPREYANNKYTSMYCNHSNEVERNGSRSRKLDEPEASKCRRKNNRNNQLSSNVNERNEGAKQIELSTSCETNGIYGRIAACNTRSSSERSKNTTNLDENEEKVIEEKNAETLKMEVAAQERKRSSKNLEEAISELEAIYNSLRLGDEDLLDRAERRSMEEFSLKRGQMEDEPVKPNRLDSPDRLKDDMAYRRMHPVERPTSLSDIIGQSSLSNISYLIASPVLSRRDNALVEPKTPTGMTRRDEPDVTRDDVVFRSIHRANNTLKVVEPQPPFGIPLGPVTAATESDYLHTVPNKSNPPRSSYIPQCEPDIVTDDLAFRTLRKDATSTIKSNADNQTNGTGESVNSEFPARKKRAVRSLSANLYGLINQERIHLHRQPSLCEISDDIESINGSRKFLEKPDHFRRVVSDGELSDQGNVRWHGERYTKKGTFDINGNHPDSGLCRKMLRVYVSPSTTMQWSAKDSKSREETPTSTFVSATRRTSSGDIGKNLWKTTREESLRDKESTDSDFTAYSRLCQDLVDTIKGTGDGDVKTNDQKKVIESTNSLRESKVEMEPLITELCNALLNDSERSSESLKKETKKAEMNEGVDFKLDEVNIVETEDDKLDYYLRLANENVKMIAEAFSSVADHLRDGLDVRDDSSGRLRTDSDVTCETSTRSSSLMVEIDENDKTQDSSTSSKNEFPRESLRNVALGMESDDSVEKHKVPNTKENCVDRRSDIEVDLNKAVEDLQIAAASLSGSIQEMEELEVQVAKLNENRLFSKEGRKSEEKVGEERKLFIVEKKDVAPEVDLGRGAKNDEEESTTSEQLEDGDERVVAVREGERNVCEMIDCTAYHENQQLARAMEMRVPYVTNIITITITEYSMVLLACLLALLLAIVAAS